METGTPLMPEAPPGGPAPDDRLEALRRFVAGALGDADYDLAPASADASFRRYFRVRRGRESFIVMDAPPPQEDTEPFREVAARLRACGVRAPAIRRAERRAGFMLLEDFGDTRLLDRLRPPAGFELYRPALDALFLIQTRADPASLPPFDRERMLGEMALFNEWLLQTHLGIADAAGDRHGLGGVYEWLVDKALAQPRVFVHRDYHSRNLMLMEHGPGAPALGILDFQDAVLGPLTYDLVSLLKDCYVKWPRARVIALALEYHARIRERLAPTVAEEGFLEWFDLMGVQRHLKAAGIFARLHHRDGKPGFLPDIPRTLSYITELAPDYPALRPLTERIRADIPATLAGGRR